MSENIIYILAYIVVAFPSSYLLGKYNSAQLYRDDKIASSLALVWPVLLIIAVVLLILMPFEYLCNRGGRR